MTWRNRILFEITQSWGGGILRQSQDLVNIDVEKKKKTKILLLEKF